MMDKKLIEAVARAIYDLMPYKSGHYLDDGKPEWVENGNSFKQDDARSYARYAIAAHTAHLEANGLVVVNEALLHRRLTCVGVLRNLNPSMASIMADNDIRALKSQASQKEQEDEHLQD
jgi:hypothetical protein